MKRTAKYALGIILGEACFPPSSSSPPKPTRTPESVNRNLVREALRKKHRMHLHGIRKNGHFVQRKAVV